MENERIIERIKNAFDRLSDADSIPQVREILDNLEIHEKFRISEKSYPEIKFKIDKKEIQTLLDSGIINEDYSINQNFEDNVLAKLLYSVLWKNGDLPKIKHIIEGILEKSDENKKGALVFYQFGKYLTKQEGEPIIDQHILRAFGIYKVIVDNKNNEIEKLKKFSLVGNNKKN